VVEAVAARVVEPGVVEELDLQVAYLLELPGAFRYASVAPAQSNGAVDPATTYFRRGF
jgi:hypothetical protein